MRGAGSAREGRRADCARERLPRKFPAVGTHGFELLDGWLALDALPSELRQRKYVNRSDVFEHAARARAGDLSWTDVLVASYAWGYARTPFGPFRITRILNQNQHIEETLSEVAELLHSNDPLGAYFVLRNPRNAHGIGKIKYLGPAFFTKFLVLCSRQRRRLSTTNPRPSPGSSCSRPLRRPDLAPWGELEDIAVCVLSGIHEHPRKTASQTAGRT